MKAWTSLAVLSLLIGGCYGFEYPKRSSIKLVESTAPAARLEIGDLEGDAGRVYLNKVIEVEGRIAHIVNKGGQPAVSLVDNEHRLQLLLTFGPDERKPIKNLRKGDRATFRGLLVKEPRYGYSGELRPALAPR